jgi:hypothetical protein
MYNVRQQYRIGCRTEFTINIKDNILKFLMISILIPRISVADMGYLFRIPDPDFYPSGSRILDPGSTNSNNREKFVVKSFFVATNFTKWKIILFLKYRTEEKMGQFSKRIIELFTQKFVTKLSKILVRDPGSEIWDSGSGNLFRIPDLGPGVKKATDPGSATLPRILFDPDFKKYMMYHLKGLTGKIRLA